MRILTDAIEINRHRVLCPVDEIINEALTQYADYLIGDAIIESLISGGYIAKCAVCDELLPKDILRKSHIGDLLCPDCHEENVRQGRAVDDTQRNDNNYFGRI